MSDAMSIYHRIQQIYVLLDDGDRRALRASGLTPTQYNLLSRLRARVDEGVTMSELAQLLLCTKGNATRLVQRLAQQGLVEVGGDAGDQRLVRVSLTSQGADRLAQARQAHNQAVERRFGSLPPQARQQLGELTQAVVASLTADLEKQSS
jgi:MarR family transcriptional regulator, 2-MHQ and catechol-resistance regulon repressor